MCNVHQLQDMSSNFFFLRGGGVDQNRRYWRTIFFLMRMIRLGYVAHQAQDGGIFGTPCLCNSPITLSRDGGFRPRGSGCHGFDKTSPIAASMLSIDCYIHMFTAHTYTINTFPWSIVDYICVKVVLKPSGITN